MQLDRHDSLKGAAAPCAAIGMRAADCRPYMPIRVYPQERGLNRRPRNAPLSATASRGRPQVAPTGFFVGFVGFIGRGSPLWLPFDVGFRSKFPSIGGVPEGRGGSCGSHFLPALCCLDPPSTPAGE